MDSVDSKLGIDDLYADEKVAALILLRQRGVAYPDLVHIGLRLRGLVDVDLLVRGGGISCGRYKDLVSDSDIRPYEAG